MRMGGIVPAGWPLRHFTLDGLTDLLSEAAPRIIELSKDFLRDDISLKSLGHAVSALRAAGDARTAFAGTTDFVRCAGFDWHRYRDYVAIQIAQARFLECAFFRLLIGEPEAEIPSATVVDRIARICDDLHPMEACIEVHGGVESELETLASILEITPAKIVVDFENMQRAKLTSETLLDLVPLDRIAYFHQRNLPAIWTEHAASLEDEERWRTLVPDGVFLWEPKSVTDPGRIRELFLEYRASH